MSNKNEILTIAGKKVVVRYIEHLSPCPRCVFYEEGCTCSEHCLKFDKGNGEGPYFVPAEEIEGTPQEVTLIPSNEDEDEAAMDYYLNLPNSSYGEGGNLLPRSINEAFKAGIAYERERLMKDAVEGEIGWSDGYRIAPADENSMSEALAKIGVLDQVGAGVDAKVSVIIIKKEGGGVLEKYENRFEDTIHNTDD